MPKTDNKGVNAQLKEEFDYYFSFISQFIHDDWERAIARIAFNQFAEFLWNAKQIIHDCKQLQKNKQQTKRRTNTR